MSSVKGGCPTAIGLDLEKKGSVNLVISDAVTADMLRIAQTCTEKGSRKCFRLQLYFNKSSCVAWVTRSTSVVEFKIKPNSSACGNVSESVH